MNESRRPVRSSRSKWLLAVGLVGVVSLGGTALVSLAHGDGRSRPEAGKSSSRQPAANASDEWPVTECGTVDGTGCAPTDKRVDLVRPQFSDPLHITNPLFPVSTLHSVVQLGVVEGKPFRSETTTLPVTGTVDWFGLKIPVVLSQYTAWLDGRIEEIALDRFAQADDGSVWYFGEDVTDYEDGVAKFTEGTWLAGRDGPPSMVMPAHPKVGDVFRVENVIGIVFEELTVTKVDQTLDGPNGPVTGAIVVDELGAGGGHSEKTLAPGYGEFLTTNETEREEMAVASPTNSLPGGVPSAVRKIVTAATGELEYVRAEDWETAATTTERIQAQFDIVDATQQPPLVMAALTTALGSLTSSVEAKNVNQAETAAVDIAQSAIDLEARYLGHLEIEIARFHNHVQRLRVHAAADDLGGVVGEVASLEWITERLRGALGAAIQRSLDTGLRDLRGASDDENVAAAADHAIRVANNLRNTAPAPDASPICPPETDKSKRQCESDGEGVPQRCNDGDGSSECS